MYDSAAPIIALQRLDKYVCACTCENAWNNMHIHMHVVTVIANC